MPTTFTLAPRATAAITTALSDRPMSAGPVSTLAMKSPEPLEFCMSTSRLEDHERRLGVSARRRIALRHCRRRSPEHGVLYTVVRAYLESFLRAATERTDGVGLPRFVEDEFRQFLTCGIHEHGVARLRCDGCGLDRLLPFSCKGEGSVRPAEAGG
jgi:Transposase zinc-binding domain